MRRGLAGAAAVLGLAAAALAFIRAGASGPAAGPAGAAPPGNGIVLGLFARDEPGFIEKNVAEIKGLGADSVSIVVPWVTPDVRSTSIRPRGDMTPADASLRAAVRESHRRGMTVFLLPLVYVDRCAKGEWRGTIAPPSWKDWFDAYGAMILHHAALAEEEGVEFLSVGSELCSSEARRSEWTGLIARIRGVYRGALTYSANWDHHEDLPFAGALDYLGINAYFELSSAPDPAAGDLAAAWRPVLSKVEAWRARHGKPLILTEVGYPSRKGAASDPWNHASEAPPDLEIQERCYRAFTEAWTGYPALAGVYFYLWWGEGGVQDAGYTPRGKPAEKVLKEWFTRTVPPS